VGLERNWKEAEVNYLKSIVINPRFAQANSLYGMICLGFMQGRFEEAEKYGRLAIKLEPLSAIDHADLAWTLYQEHKFDEALDIAKTGIELDNNSFLSHRLAGLSHLALEHYSEAIDTFKYLISISNRHQHAINSLIWAYCLSGNFTEANQLMRELKLRANTEYIAGTHMGISMAHLGNLNTALDCLERAYQDHDPILLTIKHAPHIPDQLRKEPYFETLLDKIGYPD
jgi:tetratricopeptide (TPR) repeat protein